MKKLLIIFLSSLACWTYGQKKVQYQGFPSLYWPKLYDVQYVTARDEHGEYEKPLFSETVKSLGDKTVKLPGYMVPLENETSSSRIMLSSLPLNACFFCGVGGPETVIEVYLRSKTRYIEQPIEVRGVLRLNENDPDKMMYVLEDAEIIGTLDY